MLTEFTESSIARRRLILRDSLSILSLFAGTAVLFAVTLFLFRSFTAHRSDLAQRWSARGQAALQSGHPDQAIIALRTALSYAPGTRQYELLLAEALGEAGHIDESTQYFMGLWDAQPGNGQVNLELARLAARRNQRADAINFYRAAIYGTWEGDGVTRRVETRMELARYLIANHDLPAARLELLIAGGNAPNDYDRDLAIGSLLEKAQDATDAWTYYLRASALKPDDPAAREAAGRLAYNYGDYENAERMLIRAERSETRNGSPQDLLDRTFSDNATRILELIPAASLPVHERVTRDLAARDLAKKRFDACSAKYPAENPLPPALQALDARWISPSASANAAALLRDPAQQDATMQLVYDTEVLTAKICGPPTGDDALLLLLANSPHNPPLPPLEKAAQAQPEVPRD